MSEAIPCPSCHEPHFEGTDFCGGCGTRLNLDDLEGATPSMVDRMLGQPAEGNGGNGSAAVHHHTTVDVREVTVTNVKMPFWSMVGFMVKWTIASIPAAIILFAIFTALTMAGGGLLAGVLDAAF
jgi:hypothetical protein